MKNWFKIAVVKILFFEAKLVLKRYKPKIVAVTGSVGKTSAKDAIFTVLSSSFYTRKSDKSFNSEIGIPLTILGCKNAWNNPWGWVKNFARGAGLLFFRGKYPEWLVLEVGADRPGDIKRVAKWLSPDVAVITKFGEVPVHVEYFGSREALISEKSWLARETKQDGWLILNADDEDALSFAKLSKSKVVTYGMNAGANIMASNKSIIYGEKGGFAAPEGIAFKVEYRGKTFPIFVNGSLGNQHIYPILSAFAVGLSQNINMINISESLSEHIPPKGRMRIIEGANSSTLIDDTYNASPVAVQEALKTLGSLKNYGRRIAVLGDMLELGRFSAEQHKKTGGVVAQYSDMLITVGQRSRLVAEGAQEGGLAAEKIISFEDSKKAGEYLRKIIRAGDVVLVKGSQSMRMEKVVKAAMEKPEEAKELLVRQEEEWLKK